MELSVALTFLFWFFSLSYAFYHKTCLDVAQASPFQGVEFKRPRPLPDPAIPLVAFNWAEPASQEWFNDGYNKEESPCRQAFRYKIKNGVIYSDHERIAKKHWYHYRVPLEEMLVMAMWLYGLPDMDILFNIVDAPLPCTKFPLLGFSVYTAPIAEDVHINKLQMDKQWSIHGNLTKGYAVPHRLAWVDLALSPPQYQVLFRCLDEHYPWSRKVPQVFWRGSNSGGVSNWLNVSDIPNPSHLETKEKRLFNKRTVAALLSLPGVFRWLNIGLTQDKLEEKASSMYELLRKEAVPLEEWNKYAVNLVLSGHGFTDRIAYQLLYNNVILYPGTNALEWFHPHLKAGEHFEKAEADLSDFTCRTKEIIQEFKTNSSRLHRQVHVRQQLAPHLLNHLALLDAFVWALMDMKKWQRYNVTLNNNFKLLRCGSPTLYDNKLPMDCFRLGHLPKNVVLAIKQHNPVYFRMHSH